MSKMVRLSEEAHEALSKIEKHTGLKKIKIVEDALKSYERQAFLHAANLQFERYLSDPENKKEFDKEIKEWDCTLLDGLDDDEAW